EILVYRIQEFSEVMADACLRDSEGRFLFLSIYGRDHALLQFLSALELPATQGGVDIFHLVDECGEASPVHVGGTDRLTKSSVHLPKANLFGPMSHMWVYHKAIEEPDFANRHAWVLVPGADDETQRKLQDKAWAMVQRLSPVPLLDHWRERVMAEAFKSGLVKPLDDQVAPPLGPIRGMRISLGQGFADRLSQWVESGALTLEAERVNDEEGVAA
ncbi:MAG TPA: hypothetical protein VFP68_21525, partial [Burkholderiaceae bacterium]|nr:hypothetical protein [Burkholderiaceae bacterium]